MDFVYLFGVIFLSSFFTIWAIPFVIKIAKKKNIIDEPGNRKSHNHPIPTAGGIAIFISFVSVLYFIDIKYPILEYKSIQLALLFILFTGLKDDVLISSPLSKLLMQFIAFFILIYFSDLRITSLHGIFGINELPYWASFIITVILVFAIINSFNLIDGVDGLATGIATVISISFGAWFMCLKSYNYALISFSIATSAASFFYFNVFSKKKKIFMGDTGSMILGSILAILVIKFSEISLLVPATLRISSIGIVFGLMAIPLLDSVKVFFIRLKQNRSPFRPDKTHLHHDLLTLGLSHFKVSMIIVAVNILIILVVSVFHFLSNIALIGIVLLIGILFFLIVYALKRKQHAHIQ